MTPEEIRQEQLRARERIAELEAEEQGLRTAPVSITEARERVRRRIAQRAPRFDPNGGAFAAPEPPPETTRLVPEGADLEAALCRLCPEALEDALVDDAAHAIQGARPIGTEERAARLAEVETELRTLRERKRALEAEEREAPKRERLRERLAESDAKRPPEPTS